MTAPDQFASAFKNYWAVFMAGAGLIVTTVATTAGVMMFLNNSLNDAIKPLAANQVQLQSDVRQINTTISFQNASVAQNLEQLTDRVDDLEEYRDQILGSLPYELRNSSSE